MQYPFHDSFSLEDQVISLKIISYRYKVWFAFESQICAINMVIKNTNLLTVVNVEKVICLSN